MFGGGWEFFGLLLVGGLIPVGSPNIRGVSCAPARERAPVEVEMPLLLQSLGEVRQNLRGMTGQFRREDTRTLVGLDVLNPACGCGEGHNAARAGEILFRAMILYMVMVSLLNQYRKVIYGEGLP